MPNDRIQDEGVPQLDTSYFPHEETESASGSADEYYPEDDLSIVQTEIYPSGKLSYSIPDTMDYDREYRAVLRIAKEELDSVLTSRAGKNISKEFVLVDNLRVEPVMKAELIDVSTETNFIIKPLSTPVQDIERTGYTEWEWNIKPKKSGERTLRMVIKVTAISAGETYAKDLVVYEKEIIVKSRPFKNLYNLIVENWEWAFSVLLIPLAKYLWEIFRKNSHKKNKKKHV